MQEGFAPASFFGGKIVDFTPGQTVPIDTDGDGLADTEAVFRTWLGSMPAIALRSDLNPLLRDDDGDGDLLDHFLGKPTADWQGAFGTQMTLWQNVQVNTVFEYMAGNFVVQNLTDQFRRSNPGIGRNTRKTAELEAILLNPATQGDVQARFDAAMAWVTEQASLAPFSGLNAVSPADWVRWRELGITYSVPTTFSQRLGLTNLQINAIANATEKHEALDIDNLFVEKAYINEGPRLKRIRPAPMGRALGYQRRMSHITVELGERE